MRNQTQLTLLIWNTLTRDLYADSQVPLQTLAVMLIKQLAKRGIRPCNPGSTHLRTSFIEASEPSLTLLWGQLTLQRIFGAFRYIFKVYNQ